MAQDVDFDLSECGVSARVQDVIHRLACRQTLGARNESRFWKTLRPEFWPARSLDQHQAIGDTTLAVLHARLARISCEICHAHGSLTDRGRKPHGL